ncbi:MAG TPA: glycosyl hydrolase [Thermoanaerobaculia bacterium]|nr:glycosyl hydrolase [Thermoanaerobaculia bacterium]
MKAPELSARRRWRHPQLAIQVAALLLGLLLAVASATLLAAPSLAQGSALEYTPSSANQLVDPARLAGFDFESLNFSRGGRVTAVTGVIGQPLVYYFGSTGGGVWKTTDAGNTWDNVTDGYFGVGSVGAITVAASDPNVIYVGTGSACPRGNISNGDGMYRSTDAGRTWKHIGLEAAGQVGRVRVHPSDHDLVYVAALGNIFGPNEERGVYRSKDGGTSWEKVLFVSDGTGFVDLSMDPTNPRILYAAAWRAERKPWTNISGSEDGGIWKTTDGGDTWTKLAGGLPEGLVGRIGVAVSPANPDRVWALIEAEGEKGGVYRSDDGGESWRRTNGDANIRQRPWYYTHIYADPHDANTVYALNVGLFRSVDGGSTFAEQIRVPHGDNHDLWINPLDPRNLINGNDGGANVSFDGGESWSWQMNQPTAEIYRMEVDDQWPYRVYGSQQDNSTISIPSHGFVSWNRQPPDWYPVGGCESGHIAVDPRNPNVVYAGCYGGSISRIDRETGVAREIIAYPQLQLGQAARNLKYRFQWNAPIRLSPHDPSILYHTSQFVHRSLDEGQRWNVISPDLTTDNEEQQDYAGGPISRDSTGVEVYNTIFAFEESPHRKGELWAGSDDGRIHVTRDDGGTWTEVTPQGFPAGATVNVISHSAHDPDRMFVAAYRYRVNDFAPYVYRTVDGGRSWTLLTDGTNGIPPTHFTRSVVEDPVRKGLIFAGTEYGLYVSFDDGAHWQRFGDDEKLGDDLPVSPVTDMAIHRDDLVLATQGRSFWILRDLSALRQIDQVADRPLHLFEPAVAHRGGSPAKFWFWAASKPEEPVKLEVLDGEEVLNSWEWKPSAEGDRDEGEGRGGGGFRGFGGGRFTVEEGVNAFDWPLRLEAPEAPEGVVHWGGTPGLAVLPGEYQIRLSSGDWSQSQTLRVDRWPHLPATDEELAEQYELGRRVAGRLDEIFDAIVEIRDLKSQAQGITGRMKKAGIEDEELPKMAEELGEKLSAVEEELTQVKSKSGQDPLNFPPQIDNQYVELYAYVVASNHRPPAAAHERLADLDPELDELLGQMRSIVETDVAAFNAKADELDIPALAVGGDEDDEETTEQP